MDKILAVARTEFLASVRSKGFIIGIALMPVLIGISVVAERLAEGRVDTEDRVFAVIDDTGGAAFDALAAAAGRRDAAAAAAEGAAPGRYVPIRAGDGRRDRDEVRLELSDRVRRREIFAFIEIPAGATTGGAGDTAAATARYHAENTTYDGLREWIGGVLTDVARNRAMDEAGISAESVARLNRRVRAEPLGLVSRTAEGGIAPAAPVNQILAKGVPVILMFLLFMVVMMAAPALLNSVLEEKMSRIAEVMLGSMSPFEFMMGKLLGAASESLVLALVYLGGGIGLAAHLGILSEIPPSLFAWFFVFMTFGVLFFGSLYISIGAACTQLKDAQSLMMPAMIFVLLPMFTWNLVLRAPDSTASVLLSLFPPATPMLMLLRLSLSPGPPAWQALLSLVLTFFGTLGCVWAAGRIFRVGILMQGRSASLREILGWVVSR